MDVLDELVIDGGARAALVDGRWHRLERLTCHETFFPEPYRLWNATFVDRAEVWAETVRLATGDEISAAWRQLLEREVTA